MIMDFIQNILNQHDNNSKETLVKDANVIYLGALFKIKPPEQRSIIPLLGKWF